MFILSWCRDLCWMSVSRLLTNLGYFQRGKEHLQELDFLGSFWFLWLFLLCKGSRGKQQLCPFWEYVRNSFWSALSRPPPLMLRGYSLQFWTGRPIWACELCFLCRLLCNLSLRTEAWTASSQWWHSRMRTPRNCSVWSGYGALVSSRICYGSGSLRLVGLAAGCRCPCGGWNCASGWRRQPSTSRRPCFLICYGALTLSSIWAPCRRLCRSSMSLTAWKVLCLSGLIIAWTSADRALLVCSLAWCSIGRSL